MTTLIQIFALPRSGTAFVATMLNLNPRCMAFHELHEKADQSRQIIERMMKVYKYVGDVNTHGWLMKDQMDSDIRIVIRRDTSQSINAVVRRMNVVLDENIYRAHADKLDQWAINERAMVVNYENLFNLDTLRDIWNHCFDDSEQFPVNKVDMLLSLNIQMQNTDNIKSEQYINRLKNDMQ